MLTIVDYPDRQCHAQLPRACSFLPPEALLVERAHNPFGMSRPLGVLSLVQSWRILSVLHAAMKVVAVG
jgi:hypothetical protein